MAEIIVKKSKFISLIFDIHSKDEFNVLLTKIKSENKKASHIVYAYVINNNDYHFSGYSDDNEPHGVAGIPLFKLMQNKNLINKCIIVIRFFGGIKLGKPTLLRTYLKAALLLF